MVQIADVINIAKQAGKIILQYYSNEKIETKIKADSSPVSIADLESNDFICACLNKLYPNIPIISEENEDNLIETGDSFWLIDPLDGTQSFLNKEDEFTVNIGLIKNSVPVLGVVYLPVKDAVYYVDVDNIPYKQIGNNAPVIIGARAVSGEGSKVLISTNADKIKLAQYLANKKVMQIIPAASALKICLIAEGEADLYPRFGPTMEWDTAAGHAILSAAGGSIKNLGGEELTYGHGNNKYYNPDFIAKGR